MMTIRVNDTNDNEPVFDVGLSGQIFEIDENDTDCHLNIRVTATDPDLKENGTVSYILNHTKFTIDERTGVVTCTSPLDFEEQTDYEFEVTARDNGYVPLSSTVPVQVRLMDVNDNAPVFSPRNYSATFKSEDWKEGKLLLAVTVSDKDSGTNSNITLALDSENAVFNISSGNIGVLRIKDGTLKTNKTYTFIIIATDGGQPSRTDSASVEIIVTASTDTSLVKFDKNNFEFFVDDNRTYSDGFLGTVQAVVDSGQDVNYTIIGGDDKGFELDPTSGRLTCNKSFDREEKAEYQIMVRAEEALGQGGDLALVTVVVLDVNDNVPKFKINARKLTIQFREDIANNTVIIRVDAEDKDAGDNGTKGLVYSIQNADANIGIGIDSTTADIRTTANLDRENKSSYILNITVRDSGPEPLSAMTTVTLHLTDINDNKPMFSSSTYIHHIWENTTLVDDPHVLANDPDAWQNGTVTYRVNDTLECPFQVTDDKTVSKTRGKISVRTALDYERKAEYVCHVYAIDMPLCDTDSIPVCEKRLTGTATMTVSILDNNDNDPVFQGTPYQANSSRDDVVGTVVTNVINATDADTEGNGRINFKFLPETDFFEINSTNGEITIKKKLDSLQLDVVILTIVAFDNPEHDPPRSNSVTISIHISDDNVRPWFDVEGYTVTVTEEKMVLPHFVVNITANDRKEDLTVICNCTYALVHTSESSISKHFHIDETTGVVRQVSQVDREDAQVTGSTITLVIEATDDGEPIKSTKTNMAVHIIDINDNSPYFENSTHNFRVNQMEPVGSLIGQLLLHDDDEDNTSLPVLKPFHVGGKHLVELDETGKISVKKSLKKGNETYVIFFPVQVSDSADVELEKPSKNNILTAVNITVYFENPNKHAPKFTKDIYETTLEFLSRSGRKVELKNFMAEDEDGDRIDYEITDGNTRNITRIDRSTGSIYLNFVLDYTIESPLVLTVRAVDITDNPREGFCKVHITLRNREPTVCIRQSVEDRLNSESEQRRTYLSLFAAMAALLAVAFVTTIVVCYKWRTSHNKLRMYGRLQIEDTFPKRINNEYDPLRLPTPHDYSTSVAKFDDGVRNPAYVRSGLIPSERPHHPRPPSGLPEPQPDYEDDDDIDVRRRTMGDRAPRPLTLVPGLRSNSSRYNISLPS